jgi:hypothetical protein
MARTHGERHFYSDETEKQESPASLQGFLCSYGAEDEIRTRDLLLGKEMLYQLSHFRVSIHYAENTASVKTQRPFERRFLAFVGPPAAISAVLQVCM